MISFYMGCNCTSNILLRSLSHDDFLDDVDNGKDLDDINFKELNKIGEDWEAGDGELGDGELGDGEFLGLTEV